jgi:tetratricopeptide (TPR) repeat protein
MPKAERAQLLQRALANHHAGDLNAAAALCRRVLQAHASDPEALNLLGIVLHQTGNSDTAAQCLRAAVKARRKDAALHYNLGTVLADLGKYTEAEAALRDALKLGSREPHLEMNLGNALALQGKLAQALPFYEAACKRAPRSAQVWFNYGNALRDLGRHEEALVAYRKAVTLDPDQCGAWTNQGQLLHRLESLEEAEYAYRRALETGASDAEILCSLGQILSHQGRQDEAAAFAQRALELQPHYSAGQKVAADILCKLYRRQEAEQHLRKAIALAASDWDAGIQLSDLLRQSGRAKEALAMLPAATDVPAEFRDKLDFRRSLAWMRLGDYARAWSGLRVRSAQLQPQTAEPDAPWINEPLPHDLHAATVYLRREQGLGDELFFLRFVPQLRARGAKVVYRCGAKLVPLLARCSVADRLLDADEPAPRVDYALCVGELPWALEAGSAGDPTPPSIRLEPDPARLHALHAHLAAAGPGPYLGLTWRAGTSAERQQGIKGKVLAKEIDLRALGQALAQTPATLIALQRGLREGELEALRHACGRPLHDFSAWNEDLDDALATLALLDDYVGVSNTNMHLVAALGRGAKVLLPFPPEWRWSAGGAGAAFFPGFTLYSQSSNGSWTAALTRLRDDLCES